jgi:hypothetical protein
MMLRVRRGTAAAIRSFLLGFQCSTRLCVALALLVRDGRPLQVGLSIVSTRIAATIACITCFWSAGMTYHGAESVDVAVMAFLYACMSLRSRWRSNALRSS